MSFNDFFWTLRSFLSTWPVPEWFPVFGAKGTMASCEATAFLATGGQIASILYSGSVAIFFLLVIKHDWKEESLRKAEKNMHIVINIVSWGIAVACFPLKLYNPYFFGCGIQSHPLGCTQSHNSTPENPATCLRGDNAAIFIFSFLWVPLWLTFLVVAYCMGSIYVSIYQTEKRAALYVFRGSYADNRRRQFKKSRLFAFQGALYCIFFFVTWICATIATILGQFADTSNYVLLLFAVILATLQGFFNFLIYLRPRYLSYMKDHPGNGLASLLLRRDSARKRWSIISNILESMQSGSNSRLSGRRDSRLSLEPIDASRQFTVRICDSILQHEDEGGSEFRVDESSRHQLSSEQKEPETTLPNVTPIEEDQTGNIEVSDDDNEHTSNQVRRNDNFSTEVSEREQSERNSPLPDVESSHGVEENYFD